MSLSLAHIGRYQAIFTLLRAYEPPNLQSADLTNNTCSQKKFFYLTESIVAAFLVYTTIVQAMVVRIWVIVNKQIHIVVEREIGIMMNAFVARSTAIRLGMTRFKTNFVWQTDMLFVANTFWIRATFNTVCIPSAGLASTLSHFVAIDRKELAGMRLKV